MTEIIDNNNVNGKLFIQSHFICCRELTQPIREEKEAKNNIQIWLVKRNTKKKSEFKIIADINYKLMLYVIQNKMV